MALTEICTIGYENVGQPDFVAALTKAQVKLLIDVREVANSRRAGFSKKSLAAALDDAGIAYVHLKALGTPKAGRDAARRGDNATMHAIFEEKLETPESQLALREAADLAKAKRAALMCLEHDWTCCHRAIVAARLKPLGLKAVHLSPESR
jgi:uncharacterized protein (DUF488 family)